MSTAVAQTLPATLEACDASPDSVTKLMVRTSKPPPDRGLVTTQHTIGAIL
jgi:hypothetical protein